MKLLLAAFRVVQRPRATRSRPGPHAVRGAAMIEAMIMLPFFMIIYFGIHFWGTSEIARSEALQAARVCAWKFSNSGCKDLPDECKDQGKITFGDPDIEEEIGGDNKAHREANELTGSIDDNVEGAASGKGGKLGSWVKENLVEKLKSLLGKKATPRANISVQRPSFIGGGTRNISAPYRLTCNVKNKSIMDFFGDAFKKLSPF